jgi:hypothetical protein
MLAVSLLAIAATRTYTPPAETGQVYTIIKYKVGGIGTASPTALSVKWGSWNKGGIITPPSLGSGAYTLGFVLKLNHVKKDSVPLTVATDGTIIGGPVQGGPPPEWNTKGWQQVSW